MLQRKFILGLILVSLVFASAPAPSLARQQQTGSIRGTVRFAVNRQPVPHAPVRIPQLQRTVQTDDDGSYEFTNVPPGVYTVITHLEGVPDTARQVTVRAGAASTLDFDMRLAGLREEVTVTASGQPESTFESFRSVNSVSSITLAEEAHPSIGEVLDKEPGIAKRSFGPGSARPVIRGFDGDRVLVIKDGMRTGSLGSQSGDHGEPIDVLRLERVEVVRGPTTLLYGSNALGGVVNAITRDEEDKHEGLRGFLTALGGTTNGQAGLSAGIEYGRNNWVLWGSGTGQRTGDYNTPLGRIPNSKTRVFNTEGGFGYFGDKGFFSARYNQDDRRYGVPFASEFHHDHDDDDDDDDHATAATGAFSGGLYRSLNAEGDAGEGENVDLDMRRQDFGFSAGFRNFDALVTAMRVNLNYSNYRHRELEGPEVGTTFDNDVFNYRTQFEQRRYGRLSGRFGFEGFTRNYETVGAEALVLGPVRQNAFSVFGLQELDFERVRFQFGGRIETNRYRPSDVALPDRDFTGFSGSAGVRFGLYEGGALLANFTHSYRAPALEELYNFGPHIGNLTFEIGNPNLTRERASGGDFSFRHSTRRVRLDANVFYYKIRDFVFLAPVDEDGDGELDTEDGLTVAEYLQGDSRFVGTEFGASFDFNEYLGLNLGFDLVDAKLEDGTPLPRIPPIRARVGLDLRRGGLSVRPEFVMAKDKNQVFPTETRTAGYGVFNVLGSYTIARPHFAHIFSVNAFNLGDKLYRNHLSFIKELAPEIGRGVRFTYSVRYF